MRRFLVPALTSVGVARSRMAILRRTQCGPAPDVLALIRTVVTLDALRGESFDLIFNCVSADALLPLQEELLRRYPHATHFCDTPIWSGDQDLRRVLHLHRAGVLSLEDWPLMPNLEYLTRVAAASSTDARVAIEHFGITGHFLSLSRRLHTGSRHRSRFDLRGDELSVRPRAYVALVFRRPKQFALAKASVRTADVLVEDFHEVEMAPHDDAEVLYRVVEHDSIRYLHGGKPIGAYALDAEALTGFAPLTDRKNVHELDKCVALTRLLTSILRGDRSVAYSYLGSARDALLARRLAQMWP